MRANGTQTEKSEHFMYMDYRLLFERRCELHIIGFMAKLDEGKIRKEIFSILTDMSYIDVSIIKKKKSFGTQKNFYQNIRHHNPKPTLYCNGSKNLKCQFPTQYSDY